MKRMFNAIIVMTSLLLTFGCVPSMVAKASNETASTVRDDSGYIQNLVDTAVAGSDGIKVVTIPKVNPNDPKGGSVYTLSNAIELSSNTTVKLDNCTLRLNDDVLCNVFISKGCYDTSMTSDQELKNISIIGIGDAVLDGGNHNGVTEKTATSQNGFSTVRYNTSIHFRNVNGFTVSGITIKEPRYWGMTFIFCRYGDISNINFDCSNKAPNQDGIDLRIGCNNINISDITGVAGDDVVALTALLGVNDSWFKVQGKDCDIYDVSITNVKASCKGGHGIVRLLCHHGNKVYNINIKNIEDTGTNHVQGVLRIGDTNYAGTGNSMAYGDIHSVTIDGVISNGMIAIHAPNPNVTTEHVSYKNVTVKYSGGKLTNLTKVYKTEPMSPLNGCNIYVFEGGSTNGWTYNNNDIRSAEGTLDGKSDGYTMWPIGPGKPGNGKSLELTTSISKDTTAYGSFHLQLLIAHLAGNDPAPELMKIYYSVDNAKTWSEKSIELTMKYHGQIWSTLSGTKCNVWSFTSEDLSLLTDERITNLMVRPYGEDGSFTVGAFRMISLYVVGEHQMENNDNLDAKYLVSAATCAENAVYKKSCKACGEAHATETFEALNTATGKHVFTNYVADGNATCTSNGTETAECDTCDTNAKDTREASSGATGHSYSDEYTCHDRVCTACNYTLLATTEHSWNDGEVVKEPTAAAEGEKKYTCTDCGATKTEKLDKLDVEESDNSCATVAPIDFNSFGGSAALMIVTALAVAVILFRRKRQM